MSQQADGTISLSGAFALVGVRSGRFLEDEDSPKTMGAMHEFQVSAAGFEQGITICVSRQKVEGGSLFLRVPPYSWVLKGHQQEHRHCLLCLYK